MIYWLFSILGLLIVIYYYRIKHSYWQKFGVKGPLAIPCLGTNYLFFWKSLPAIQMQLVQKYGPIVGMYEGSRPVLYISDPEFFKLIAVKEFQSFPQGYHFSNYQHPLESLFPELLWGPKWKQSRGHLTQCLTTAKLKKVFPMIEKCCEVCIKSLEDELENKDTIDMSTFWTKYFCNSIFQSCLQIDAQSSGLVEKMRELVSPFVQGCMSHILLPEWFTSLLGLSIFDGKALNYLEKLVGHFMEIRRSKPNAKLSDILNHLLILNESKVEQLTDSELIAGIADLIFNGFETPAVLLAWCCLRLALNPECQDRLVDEIDSLTSLDHDSLMSAHYLDAVINESLRMDPPLVHTERICHQTYLHPETAIVIPTGAKVSISIYAMHHDPSNFPDPDKFDPDRFLPENRDSIKQFTFIPFGAGHRICPGVQYTLMTTKLALAKVIQLYRFSVTPSMADDIDYTFGSVFLTAKQINVKLEKR